MQDMALLDRCLSLGAAIRSGSLTCAAASMQDMALLDRCLSLGAANRSGSLTCAAASMQDMALLDRCLSLGAATRSGLFPKNLIFSAYVGMYAFMWVCISV